MNTISHLKNNLASEFVWLTHFLNLREERKKEKEKKGNCKSNLLLIQN